MGGWEGVQLEQQQPCLSQSVTFSSVLPRGGFSGNMLQVTHKSNKADEWMGVKLDQVHSQASQNPTLAFAQL